MTKRSRRNHGAEFKAKVALAAVRGEKTTMQEPDKPNADALAAASTQNTGVGGAKPNAEKSTPNQVKRLAQLVGLSWTNTILFAVVFLLLVVAAAALAYVCWFRAIPFLYGWGFDNWGFKIIWKSVLAILAFFYLSFIPLLPFFAVPYILDFLSELTFRQEVRSARNAQKEIEGQLSGVDSHQVVLVLRYSREVLKEYYALGMDQAQRSYRYALIAMWLGFVVLLIGVGDQLGWLAAAFPELGSAKEGKVSSSELVLLTGAVMEFIAGAFLWVYRTSLEQLIYFYRRQYSLHKTLLAERLARGMTQKNDEASLAIIHKLMEESEDLKVEAAKSGGIAELLKRFGKAEPASSACTTK